MLTNNWKSELYRLLLWLGAGLIIGWLLDLTLWAVAFAACGFAARSIYKLHQLQQWLAHRSSIEPPEASGMWGEVMDGLYRMQQKYRRERVRLRALISYLRESFTSLPYGAVIIDAVDSTLVTTVQFDNPAFQDIPDFWYQRDYLPRLRPE